MTRTLAAACLSVCWCTAPYALAQQPAAPRSASPQPPGYAAASPTLPPAIERFGAAATDCATHLSWTVSDRARAEEYRVLVSRNGVDFATVGTLAARGPDPTYELDVPSEAGTLYFELVGVVGDGRMEVLAQQTVAVTCVRLVSTATP